MTPEAEELVRLDPTILHGQAHIRGTRVPVSVVLDCLASGMSEDEILAEYPTLTVEGIRAAAAYGAELAREEVRPLGSRAS
ncbi:MAG: DUF433 domain-containing protein [Actinomycetota bacterium]|nr:DUF433 domain-containing protein [Actinomycetota bacterium]